MFQLIPRPSALTDSIDEVNEIVDKKLTGIVSDQLDLNLNTVLHGDAKTEGSLLNGMTVTMESGGDNVQEFTLFNTIEQTVASLLSTRYVQVLDAAVNEVNMRHPEYRR